MDVWNPVMGTASNSNLEILQRFQSKLIRTITHSPCYKSKKILHRDLNISTIRNEIQATCAKYLRRLECHKSHLAINLLDNPDNIRRLKRKHPT